MKKIAALVLAVLMLFACVACGSDKNEEVATIQATYSLKSLEGEFVIEVQDLGGVYSELYDKNGIYIKFKDGEKIYDKEGKEISREDLIVGDTLEIHYNGKLSKKNPKTITAYKVVKMF